MVLISDDFEACNLDAWSGDKTYMSCSSEQPHAGTYSLKVYNVDYVYGFNEIYKTWTATGAEIKAVFYWRVIGFVSTPALIRILDAASAQIIYLIYSSTNLKYLSNGAWYNVPDFDPDVGIYYKIDVRVRPETKKFDIYIDDVKKVDNVDWGELAAGNPTQFRFCCQRGSCRSQYYADDLNVDLVAPPPVVGGETQLYFVLAKGGF